MGSSIDRRIVEMSFDNKSFESGVSETVKTIDTLKKGLNFNESIKSVGGLSQAFKAFTLGKISDNVGELNDKFSLFGAAAFSIMQKLTSSAIEWGKQIINSVTGLKAAKAGLAEYETQINAIQTILANTNAKGTTMSEVMGALSELNTYADKTIYNFTEMTRNIGTFTAAGTDLETSVSAIKGIANLAAVSGSTSQQAATGMYQLSQAISTGTVRLMDWNSVSNAGMGGAIFQKALTDTARVHGVKVDEMIAKEGSFRASLAQNWLSSEILLETLSTFTGDLSEAQLLEIGYTQQQAAEILKLGKMANDAATKVKTFTQLKDTLNEMSQSGWTKTWELLVGNFEQAKDLFTGASNALGALIEANANARNKILEGWNKMGGRDILISAISNAFNKLLAVIEPVKEAFREIFPPVTAQTLMKLTTGLRLFINSIKTTKPVLENIKNIFKGVFAVIDILRIGIVALVKGIVKLISPLSKVSGGFTNILLKVSNFVQTLRVAITETDWFNVQIDKAVGFIHALVSWIILAAKSVGQFVVNLKESITVLGGKFSKAISSLELDFSGLTNFFKSFGEGVKKAFSTFKSVDTGPLTSLIEKFTGVKKEITLTKDSTEKDLSGLAKIFNKFLPIFKKVGDGLSKAFKWLGDKILEGLDNISFENITDTINTGLLTSLTLGMQGVFKELTRFISGGFLVAITTAVTNFINAGSGTLKGVSGILDGVKGSLEAWQGSLKAKTLGEIAKAIGLIALSLLALSFVDPTKLAYSTGAITVIFADLMASMAIFEKVAGTGGAKMAVLVAAMTGISVSILVLSLALVVLSKLDWEGVKTGLAGLGGIAVVLIATSRLLSKNAGVFLKASIGLTAFSLGIIAMAGAIRIIGTLDPAIMGTGLLIVAGIIGEFILFTRLMGDPAKAIVGAVSMTILAGGIYILALAVAKLGALGPDVLKQGLIAMSAGLLVLFAALKIMPKDIAIKAIGLVGLSYALTLLADAMKSMGGMSWEEIARGLTVLGGSLTALSVALHFMKGAIGGAIALVIAAYGLTVLAGAIKLMGEIPIEKIGTALLAIVGVFAVFGLAGLILGPLVPVLLGLGAAMLLLGVAALAFGVGVSALATGLVLISASGLAGIAVFAAFVTTLITLLPMIATGLADAFSAFIDGIATNGPKIFGALKVILLGLIDTMVETIPATVDAIILLVDKLIEALVDNIPKIIDAGFELITSLLTSIRDNIPEIVTLAGDIIIEFLESMATKIPDIIAAGVDLVIAFIQGITDSTLTLVDAAFEMMITFIDGLTLSIEEHVPELVIAASALGDAIITGFLAGLSETGIGKVVKGVVDIGKQALNALGVTIDSKSPSRETQKLGNYFVMGFINGIKDLTSSVTKPAKVLGKETLSVLSKAVDKASDVFNDMTDISPVIRPVVDMSAVLASGQTINDLYSKDRSFVLSSAINRVSQIATNNGKISNAEPSSVSNNQTVSFVQNNYSPEALSRLDIYRQTRNQLNTLKGLVTP